MKTANLGDYFLWEGQVVRCDWIIDGDKTIGFTIKDKCPHCGGEIVKCMDVIESSPMFQEGAELIKTIKL